MLPIPKTEEQKSELLYKSLHGLLYRMYTILEEVGDTEYSYVYDGVTSMLVGDAEDAIRQYEGAESVHPVLDKWRKHQEKKHPKEEVVE